MSGNRINKYTILVAAIFLLAYLAGSEMAYAATETSDPENHVLSVEITLTVEPENGKYYRVSERALSENIPLYLKIRNNSETSLENWSICCRGLREEVFSTKGIPLLEHGKSTEFSLSFREIGESYKEKLRKAGRGQATELLFTITIEGTLAGEEHRRVSESFEFTIPAGLTYPGDMKNGEENTEESGNTEEVTGTEMAVEQGTVNFSIAETEEGTETVSPLAIEIIDSNKQESGLGMNKHLLFIIVISVLMVLGATGAVMAIHRRKKP